MNIQIEKHIYIIYAAECKNKMLFSLGQNPICVWTLTALVRVIAYAYHFIFTMSAFLQERRGQDGVEILFPMNPWPGEPFSKNVFCFP